METVSPLTKFPVSRPSQMHMDFSLPNCLWSVVYKCNFRSFNFSRSFCHCFRVFYALSNFTSKKKGDKRYFYCLNQFSTLNAYIIV